MNDNVTFHDNSPSRREAQRKLISTGIQRSNGKRSRAWKRDRVDYIERRNRDGHSVTVPVVRRRSMSRVLLLEDM